jgi:DNA-binding response OmpR family regulator
MLSAAVLIVEDNSRLADLAAATLAGDGADVIVADSVAKAIALVEQRGFDVIVTDFALTDGDGLSVARALCNPHSAADVSALERVAAARRRPRGGRTRGCCRQEGRGRGVECDRARGG